MLRSGLTTAPHLMWRGPYRGNRAATSWRKMAPIFGAVWHILTVALRPWRSWFWMEPGAFSEHFGVIARLDRAIQ